MQEFDTLKVSIPCEAVRSARGDIWHKSTHTNTGTGETLETLKARSETLPIGVSNLSTAKGGKDMQLTFSAKVLGQDYLQGLTLNNWDRVFEELSPIIDIDKNIVFDNSQVFTCDTTNNLLIEDIGYKHSKIYSALLSGRSNFRFLPISYNSKTKKGIEFRGVQGEKNRMIVYSKDLDLLKKDNKDFLRSLNSAKLIQEAEKQIRFEVNHTTLRSIRNRLKIEDNKLSSVLQSKAPVNHNFLKKVMSIADLKQTTLFGEWETFSEQGGEGRDFVIYKGIQSIIKDLDCSDILVKNMFQNIFNNEEVFKYHWHKKKNSIKQILEYERTKKYGIESKTSDLIINKVLETLLRAVA